jgi:hypothetical protein
MEMLGGRVIRHLSMLVRVCGDAARGADVHNKLVYLYIYIPFNLVYNASSNAHFIDGSTGIMPGDRPRPLR